MGFVAIVFAGALLCNALPHLMSGVRGDRFPTPFARPPGVGNSSPIVNVVWGSANLAASIWLMRPIFYDNLPHGLMFMAAGFVASGLLLAWHFGKHRAG